MFLSQVFVCNVFHMFCSVPSVMLLCTVQHTDSVVCILLGVSICCVSSVQRITLILFVLCAVPHTDSIVYFTVHLMERVCVQHMDSWEQTAALQAAQQMLANLLTVPNLSARVAGGLRSVSSLLRLAENRQQQPKTKVSRWCQ